MAFLGQLTAKLNDLKSQIPVVVEQANRVKQNVVPVFSKGIQQLDTLGKILQVGHFVGMSTKEDKLGENILCGQLALFPPAESLDMSDQEKDEGKKVEEKKEEVKEETKVEEKKDEEKSEEEQKVESKKEEAKPEEIKKVVAKKDEGTSVSDRKRKFKQLAESSSRFHREGRAQREDDMFEADTADMSDEMKRYRLSEDTPTPPKDDRSGSSTPTQEKVNMERNQSPIDIVAEHTGYDPALENAVFRFDYDETAVLTLSNIGSTLSIKYPDGASNDFGVSFIDGEEYHLDTVTFHWDNEIMNGSEHTVGGVGYAGEIHFIHRNLKYSSMETATKQPNGVVALAVFLNEARTENLSLLPVTNALAHVKYNETSATIQGLRFSELLPGSDKSKEFWVYDGSETIAPYRENVKWIVFRSATTIQSDQLERLREVCQNKREEEHDVLMKPKRELQNQNGRIIRASFRGAGNAQLPD